MDLIRQKIFSETNPVVEYIPTPVVQYIAGQIEAFTLIDVGCSGGLDPAWRDFGSRLRAFGFDPQVQEIERLIKAESNPQVKYVAGFVGGKEYALRRDP